MSVRLALAAFGRAAAAIVVPCRSGGVVLEISNARTTSPVPPRTQVSHWSSVSACATQDSLTAMRRGPL